MFSVSQQSTPLEFKYQKNIIKCAVCNENTASMHCVEKN